MRNLRKESERKGCWGGDKRALWSLLHCVLPLQIVERQVTATGKHC